MPAPCPRLTFSNCSFGRPWSHHQPHNEVNIGSTFDTASLMFLFFSRTSINLQKAKCSKYDDKTLNSEKKTTISNDQWKLLHTWILFNYLMKWRNSIFTWGGKDNNRNHTIKVLWNENVVHFLTFTSHYP